MSVTTDLWRMSATDLAEAIRSKQASSHEVIEAHLRRVEAVNPAINAVTVVLGEQAVEAAKAADHAVAGGGDLPPFHGVPFTVNSVGAGDRPSLPRGPVPRCRGGAGGEGRHHHANRSRVAVTGIAVWRGP